MWSWEPDWMKPLWVLILLAAVALGGVSGCLDSESDEDDDNGADVDDGDNGDGDDDGGDDDGGPVGEDFDALIQSFLEEKFSEHDADPCFAVGKVTSEGVEIGTACTDEETGQPVNEDSRFQIGSITKPMLGIVTQAVMAEQGESDDTAVDDWLRDEADVPENEEGNGGVEIRLAHLLTHTSGFARFPVPPLPVNDWDDPYKDITEEALVDTLSKDEILEGQVGEYIYSNYGTMLLTLAVTDRAGEDFGELLDEVIFSHAGMADAGLDRDVIQGHTDDGEPTVPWEFHENVAGLGGVSASVNDMVAFMETNMEAADDPDLAPLWDAQQELADPDDQSVGSLWSLSESWYEDGQTLVSHDGLVGGFTSFVIFERDGERGVVVLADTFGIDGAEGIFDEVSELAITLLDPEEELEPDADRSKPALDPTPARVAAREEFLDTVREQHDRRRAPDTATSPDAAKPSDPDPSLVASWPLNGARLDHFPREIQLSASARLDASRLHPDLIRLERIHPDGSSESVALDPQAVAIEPLDQHANSFRIVLPDDLEAETGHFRLTIGQDELLTDLSGRTVEDFSMRFRVKD